MKYIYLHGFASSPQSSKAQYLQRRFANLGLELEIPDLNLGNFSEVSLTRQLDYLQATYGNTPMAIAGSSLGGFLAMLWARVNPQVERLVLLAPAIDFGRHFAEHLGEEAIAQWQAKGSREFYHYGFKRPIELDYEFLRDAQTYSELEVDPELPILIIHGMQDEVVPCELSIEFAKNRPNTTLELIESDHGLADGMEFIWQRMQEFLSLSPL
jgi:uncharacterized protein